MVPSLDRHEPKDRRQKKETHASWLNPWLAEDVRAGHASFHQHSAPPVWLFLLATSTVILWRKFRSTPLPLPCPPPLPPPSHHFPHKKLPHCELCLKTHLFHSRFWDWFWFCVWPDPGEASYLTWKWKSIGCQISFSVQTVLRHFHFLSMHFSQ